MALHGKIAVVDLARQAVEVSRVPGDWREKYLGGRSMAVYLYCRHVGGGAGVVSAREPVVIGAGLLCGTLASPVGFAVVTARSPAAGGVTTTVLDGTFAGEMRRSGFDHLVVLGRSKDPVALWVRDGRIDFRDARGLLDLEADAVRTRARMVREAGDESIAVCCPGTGVQKQSPPAGSRAGAGRKQPGGAAPLWADNNLKAVACRGRLDIQVKFPELHLEMEKRLQSASGSDPARPPAAAHPDERFDWAAGTVPVRELAQIVAESLGVSHEPEAVPGRDFWATLAKRLHRVTGLNLEEKRLMAAGYRCAALERLLRIRDGIQDPELAGLYRRTGWTRSAVIKRAKVFTPLGIDDLWEMFA